MTVFQGSLGKLEMIMNTVTVFIVAAASDRRLLKTETGGL